MIIRATTFSFTLFVSSSETSQNCGAASLKISASVFSLCGQHTKGREGEVNEREGQSLGSGRECLDGCYCFLYSVQSTVKCLSVKIIYSESVPEVSTRKSSSESMRIVCQSNILSLVH